MENADFDTLSCQIYKELKILKLNDLLTLKLNSFMWDLDHNVLPANLNGLFSYVNEGHNYETRAAQTGLIQPHRDFRTANNNSFVHKGTQVFNEMKKSPHYNPLYRKVTFLHAIKQEFLNSYDES